MPTGKVTTHFTWAEAACRCGCSTPLSLYPNIKRAAQQAEKVRSILLDRPMIPNSWYRCPSYNKKIKGAPKSQHLLGLAIDFVCKDLVPSDVQDIIFDKAYPNIVKGLGMYPGFTHIDFRTGKPELWGDS